MTFPMVATNWNVLFHSKCRYPVFVDCFQSLSEVHYDAEIRDPNKNSSQITHDQLDHVLARELGGLSKHDWPRQAKDADILLQSGDDTCVIEVERSNHEKYLRDLLKIHAYLYHGASVGVLVVPENHAHRHGEVKTLEIAQRHIESSMKYGMWNPDFIDRFFLVSYRMSCAQTGVEYSRSIRDSFISRARLEHS